MTLFYLCFGLKTSDRSQLTREPQDLSVTPCSKVLVKAYHRLAMVVLTCVLLATAGYFCLVMLYGLDSAWGPLVMESDSATSQSHLRRNEAVFRAIR